MQEFFQRILNNAVPVAALLFAAGAGLGLLRLAEPAVIAFLACGMLLMVKSGLAPKPVSAAVPQGAPVAAQG